MAEKTEKARAVQAKTILIVPNSGSDVKAKPRLSLRLMITELLYAQLFFYSMGLDRSWFEIVARHRRFAFCESIAAAGSGFVSQPALAPEPAG
ncbi:hypothetical protein [Cohnella massiliensis]|uniref:hypothetical protein n=1 Tax=Cohnella massiliensis TaxID=1816691 RepID=UPI0011182F3A|nr:hypothetical protein [Cohnella massiliensis]